MRLFLGVVILILCVVCGYFMSDKFTKRRKFYDEYNCFHKTLINEVGFSQRSIFSILKSEEEKGDFLSCFDNYINQKDCLSNLSYLCDEELSQLKLYFQNVGAGDKTSQLEYLNSVSEFIDKKNVFVSEEEKKYKSLYIKMGFLIGLIILIVIL